MNLYLLKSEKCDEWEYYKSAVVVARSAVSARKIHASGDNTYWGKSKTWCDMEDVIVEYIGKAGKNMKEGTVVIADFQGA